MQMDPIGLAGGLNLYGFAGGDPVNFSDPFGLCTPAPECFLQAAADWGAKRGGALGKTVLNVAAAVNGITEATQINRIGRGIDNGDIVETGFAAAEFLPIGKVGRVDEVVDGVRALGARVKPHPTRTGQGVAIDFGDGTVIDVRVETHGGLHGNVQRFENGKEVSNTHVRPKQ